MTFSYYFLARTTPKIKRSRLPNLYPKPKEATDEIQRGRGRCQDGGGWVHHPNGRNVGCPVWRRGCRAPRDFCGGRMAGCLYYTHDLRHNLTAAVRPGSRGHLRGRPHRPKRGGPRCNPKTLVKFGANLNTNQP